MDLTVKICGLRTPETLHAAIEAGADWVGFVFFPKSPRHVALDEAKALAPLVAGRAKKVALLVDPSDGLMADVIAAFGVRGRATRFQPGWNDIWVVVDWATGVGVATVVAFANVTRRLILTSPPGMEGERNVRSTTPVPDVASPLTETGANPSGADAPTPGVKANAVPGFPVTTYPTSTSGEFDLSRAVTANDWATPR